MSFIDDEIASQPNAWRRAATLAPTLKGVLPSPGARVAVVGCGTSWFMAQAYAALREGTGQGTTDAFTATAFPVQRYYDHIIAITRSGTTTEILALLSQLPRERTSAISADLDTPIATVTDRVIDLRFADEQSVVQTQFATTVLALLRSHLGEDIETIAGQAEEALAETISPRWLAAEQLTFLGTGWAAGIASEAALKLREASQAWTEAYPTAEYRHGPISIAAPGRLVWQFGTSNDKVMALT